MASAKIVFVLSAAVGAAFIYHGICKLSPNVDETLHVKMKKHFVNYARMAPLKLMKLVWWQGSQYRQYIGGLELAGGCGLLTMTGKFSRNISYVLLILSSLFMCHSYSTLGDPTYKYAIHICMGAIAFAMFLVERRYSVREEVTVQETSEGKKKQEMNGKGDAKKEKSSKREKTKTKKAD